VAGNKTYDVVLIGAGSVGTPAAIAREAGLKTLVIDRCWRRPGRTRRIGGPGDAPDPARSAVPPSPEIFSAGKRAATRSNAWDYFVAYREERTLKELLVIQQEYGLNIRWHDAAGVLKIVPDLNPVGLRGGTLSPDDGHASPLLIAHAFYNRARRLGVEFRFNETVTGLAVEGGRVSGVRTDRGVYGAGVVINAAGARAAEVARLAGIDVPVTPDSHEAAVTEPVARFLDPLVVDIRPVAGSCNYYFHQHHTGQVIFCITPSPSIWGFDTRETSSFLPQVAERMVQTIPRLRNLRVRRTWRGLYPMTPDGFPIVGWTKEPEGYLLAVGMCGQGVMLGPGLGELVARIVLKKETKEDRETLGYLSPDRDFKGQEKLK
jgi:sarcosine oxidase subunit beta